MTIMNSDRQKVIEEILAKIPRPNYEEIPDLYLDLDRMAMRIGLILTSSELYEKSSGLIRFDLATPDTIYELIAKDPDVMIPFFVMVCGFSVRELERIERIAGISDIYTLRKPETFKRKREKARRFAELATESLRHPLYLETVLYKFYKNWEEHQKRHYRGRIEEKVREFIRQHGYPCDKVKIRCEGKEVEIDAAIPPNPRGSK